MPDGKELKEKLKRAWENAVSDFPVLSKWGMTPWDKDGNFNNEALEDFRRRRDLPKSLSSFSPAALQTSSLDPTAGFDPSTDPTAGAPRSLKRPFEMYTPRGMPALSPIERARYKAIEGSPTREGLPTFRGQSMGQYDPVYGFQTPLPTWGSREDITKKGFGEDITAKGWPIAEKLGRLVQGLDFLNIDPQKGVEKAIIAMEEPKGAWTLKNPLLPRFFSPSSTIDIPSPASLLKGVEAGFPKQFDALVAVDDLLSPFKGLLTVMTEEPALKEEYAQALYRIYKEDDPSLFERFSQLAEAYDNSVKRGEVGWTKDLGLSLLLDVTNYIAPGTIFKLPQRLFQIARGSLKTGVATAKPPISKVVTKYKPGIERNLGPFELRRANWQATQEAIAARQAPIDDVVTGITSNPVNKLSVQTVQSRVKNKLIKLLEDEALTPAQSKKVKEYISRYTDLDDVAIEDVIARARSGEVPTPTIPTVPTVTQVGDVAPARKLSTPKIPTGPAQLTEAAPTARAADVPVTPAPARAAVAADPVTPTVTEKAGGMPTDVTTGVTEGIPPGNRFVGYLRNIQEVANEVASVNNPVARWIANSFVNRSAVMDSGPGKLVIAYQRGIIASEELVDTAITTGLGVHVRGGREGIRGLPARIINRSPVRINAKGQFADTKHQWNDVFSRPDDPRWASKLTPVERSYIDDYQTIVAEGERMRVAAGLKPRGLSEKDGWFYIPRRVRDIKGRDIIGTDPDMQRMFEEATEGYAAGVNYIADPKETLALHLRSAYQDILTKQLEEAVSPYGVKAAEVVAPEIKDARRIANEAVSQSQKEVDGLNRELKEFELIGDSDAAVHIEKALLDANVKLDSAKAASVAPQARYDELLKSITEHGKGRYAFSKQEGTIDVAKWRDLYYPKKDAEYLKSFLDIETPPSEPFALTVKTGTSYAQKFANQIRFLATVTDFAEPLIQGLPLMFRHPVKWSQATLRHYQAFADPTVFARFARENADTLQEMSSYGISVGDPEMLVALRKGEGLSPLRFLEPWSIGKRNKGTTRETPRITVSIPKGTEARAFFREGGRQTFGRFQASYNTGLGMSRVLMWKGLKPTWEGSLDELASYIRNMTGALDSRALGIGQRQRAVESFWLAFSPRLFRSFTTLTVDAIRAVPSYPVGKATAKQKESFRALANLSAGVIGIYIASGYMLGKSEEEILKGLNPLNGKEYLSHRFGDDWVGVPGQMRAMSQLLGAIGAAIARGDPELLKAGTDNPIFEAAKRYLEGRGPIGRTLTFGAMEALTPWELQPYEDLDGTIDLAQYIGTQSLPFAIKGKIEGEGIPATASSLIGFRTSPVGPTVEKEDIAREVLSDAESYKEVISRDGYEEGIAWSKMKGLDNKPGVEYRHLSPATLFKVSQDERYEELVKKSRENQKKFSPEIVEYYEFLDRVENTRDEDLEELWKNGDNISPEYPRSPGYRYKRDRSKVFAAAHNAKKAAEDLLKKNKFIQEITSPLQEAREAYIILMFTEDEKFIKKHLEPGQSYTPMEDEEGVNWDERERRKLYLEKQYSKKFVADMERYFERNLPDIEKLFREHKKEIEKTRYWDIPKYDQQGRKRMRLVNPDLDSLLLYWGYTKVPVLETVSPLRIPGVQVSR